MLTREILKALRGCLAYEDEGDCKDCINNFDGGLCFTETQDVIDSHLAAIDEIERLKAEVAAMQEENKNLHTSIREHENTISERDGKIMRLYRDMAQMNVSSYKEGHKKGFLDAMAKPQSNTTGNLGRYEYM